MPQVSYWPPLTKKGLPRQKRGPKPKAPHEKEWKEPKGITRPQASYTKKRRQDVLLWMINHRVEDVEEINAAKWRSDAPPCVEKEPRKMPDGSEKWFRAPTHNETANFWKIPLRTISHWWQEREKIFGGVVPESAIPLVHPSQRNRPKTKAPTPPPAPDPPARRPYPPVRRSRPLEPSGTSGIIPLALPASVYPGPLQGPPRLAPASAVYPQAAQPSGPPLHPLYRAHFALTEVSSEVSRLMQDQHNVHLENLLRAIALSQALVNDLTEAHKVLLDPQSYPQYYPPAAYSQPPQQYQQQPPPPPPYLSQPPQPQPPLPQGIRPLSQVDVGRLPPSQPAPTQPHAHNVSQQWQQPPPQPTPPLQPPPTEDGPYPGQFTWRVAPNGGLQHLQTAVPEHNRMEPPRKRGYYSTNGPGGTEEQPIVVEAEEEEDEVDGAAAGRREVSSTGREERNSASDPKETDKDTAMADRGSESDVYVDAVGEIEAPKGPNAENDGGGASGDRQSMPSADAVVVEQGDANANGQNSTNTAVDDSPQVDQEEEENIDDSEAGDPGEKSQEEPSQSMDPEAGHEATPNNPVEVESVISSEDGQESIIEEQSAEPSADDEGSADKREMQDRKCESHKLLREQLAS